jgi:myosin heavy subunit
VTSDPSINDARDWSLVDAGLDTMGFSKSHKEDVFKIIAAILHLGNVAFEQAGGAQVRSLSIM